MTLKASGIYGIHNLITNKWYIGQSVDLHRRYCRHWNKLSKGLHPNKHLQSAWNFQGKDNFEWVVLELCSEDFLTEKEQFYINEFQAHNREYGYNKTLFAGTTKNYKHTPEALAKIGKAAQYKHTAEHVRKVTEAQQKEYIIYPPTGEPFKIKGLNAFCKSNNLTASAMARCLEHKQHQHKGYRIERIYI